MTPAKNRLYESRLCPDCDRDLLMPAYFTPHARSCNDCLWNLPGRDALVPVVARRIKGRRR
jgi:hypothetical protein